MGKNSLDEALFVASWRSPLHIVNLLLSANADVNYFLDSGGESALHRCCRHGDISIAKVLIGAHANVNARTNSSETPLSLSVLHGHNELTSVLKDAGAKASCMDGGEARCESFCLAGFSWFFGNSH